MDAVPSGAGISYRESCASVASGRRKRAYSGKKYGGILNAQMIEDCDSKSTSHWPDSVDLGESQRQCSKFRAESEKEALLAVGKLLKAVKEEPQSSGNRAILKSQLSSVARTLGNSPSHQLGSMLSKKAAHRAVASKLSDLVGHPEELVNPASLNANDSHERNGVHCNDLPLDLKRRSRKSESGVVREVPLAQTETSPNDCCENENENDSAMYLTVEPASPVESHSPSTGLIEEGEISCGTVIEQSRPACTVLLKRKWGSTSSSSFDKQSEPVCKSAHLQLPSKSLDAKETDWHGSETDEVQDDLTVDEEDSERFGGSNDGLDNDRSTNRDGASEEQNESDLPRWHGEMLKRARKVKAKALQSEPVSQHESVRSRGNRSAKYASNANAQWRVLQADEVVANAVSRSRLKQLVRELISEHTQAQSNAGGTSRLFVKRICELMRERHRILILEGSVRTLIMQTDLVRLRSGVYAPFDGTSDVAALQTRLGEVGCAAMLRERTQRSQVETVLSELAATKRAVRTRELMRTCRARFRLPRDRYFYNHVAHKFGFLYNWNLQSWVRRGDDVSDLVGRLAKLNEELKGVAKVFANRGGESPSNADAEDAEEDDSKPGVLVVDDQHVEMAVRRAAAGILDKVRARGCNMTVEQLRESLRSQHIDADIVQNDAFMRFVFEEASFAQTGDGCFEPQSSAKAANAPKWFRCWLMNKILARLFADGGRQSVHYYELQAEALKMGIQLRLVRQVFLMYALDDFYMVEHRWVPIDERFLRLLTVTRETLAELRGNGVQVTKAILLTELESRGVKPHERGMPKLLERIGYTFSYLDHSYVPVENECKAKP